MKKTLQCPKCDGRKIWHVAEIGIRDRNGVSTAVPVVLARRKLLGLTLPSKPVGAFEAFVCKVCGFSELYAKGVDQLEEQPGVVTLLDSEPKATLR